MKIKIFLATLLLTTITAISVLFIFSQRFIPIKYYLAYDYQPGNQENKFKIERTSGNENLGYFFGDSLFKYDSYKFSQGQVFYNGDWTNVKKTKVINQEIKVWKNDFQSKQLILFKNNNRSIYNLKIQVVPSKENSPLLHTNFILPIKAHNKIADTSIYTGEYSSFDEIGADDFVLPEMKFDLQPVLIYVKTSANDQAGNYEYKINLSFTNEEEETNEFSFLQKVVVLDFDIKNNPDYGTGQATDFGYDSMIFPTGSQKWILQNQNLKHQPPEIRLLEQLQVGGGDIFWNAWDYMKDQNNQDFLKPENQDFFIRFFKKFNEDLNMSYGYTPDLGINYLKYFVKNLENEPDDLTSLPIFSGQNGRLKNLLKNPLLELKISFDVFDDYINFLIASGYKKIHMPIAIRNANSLPFLYTSKNYPFDFQKRLINNGPLPRLTLKSYFIDEDGNLTSDGQAFYKELVSEIVKQLSQHIAEKYQNQEFLLPDSQKFKFLFSFDETKYETNQFIWNIVAENDSNHVLGSHGYLGWQFEVNFNDENELQTRMVDAFDEITIQERDFLKYGETQNQKIAQERKLKNKITSYYSTWKTYPASFLGSNPAESFWSEINAFKLGSNGFGRWQLDGFKNNLTLDQEDTTSQFEPGDAYQIYPGDENGPHYSLRLINYIEGIKDVWKLKYLLENSDDGLISNLLKQITFVANGHQNTNYKWDLEFWNREKISQFLATNQSTLTISQQTELVKMFLYYYFDN